MKRFFAFALSLALLLLLAGFAAAASVSINIIGKFAGNAQLVSNQDYITSTPMIVRILNQNGALFYGTVSFPNLPGWGTTNFNGVIYEGGFRITGNEMTGDGKYIPSNPPYISGCFQSPAVPGETKPASTGLFYLKRTSTDPTAP